MNRATPVLADWDNRVSQGTASKHDQKLTEDHPPRRRLQDNRLEQQRLQDEVDAAAATVIAALLAENAALREPAGNRSAVVTRLGRTQAARE
ncbi:hypothetical protein ABT288_46155 [Streptomyces sp. NPDC001093]|uniref:hypothetical protein n=1 Tax=Streptomyces sp. NPDC001093 TaxID=3154376 RepID=UPI003317C280